MRKGKDSQHSKGHKHVENEADSFECVQLHGTLFVYVRRAARLGQSALRHPQPEEKLKMRGKLSAGARFVGKKMLNAVRATNNVRFLYFYLQIAGHVSR